MKTETPVSPTIAPPEAIYQGLRRRILSFEMQPGEVLSENALAEQMQVSRAPVRDAMARLVEEGYVRVFPQRGSVVTQLAPERIRQAVFLRVTLERSIVEELCRTPLTPDQIEMLEQSLDLQRDLRDADTVLPMIEEDERMHALLYAFVGRLGARGLFRTFDCDQLRIRILQMRTFSYSRRVQLTAVSGWENCLLEHRMLLDALKKQETETACLIVVNHINAILWHADNLQKLFPHYFLES